jgi:hypothetical protein
MALSAHQKRLTYLRKRFLVEPYPIVAKGARRWIPTDSGLDAARKLRDDCAAAEGHFFWKQWGGVTPTTGGRLLDGRTHDEMPTQIPGALPEGYVHSVDHDRHKAAAKGQLRLDVVS